MEKFSIYQSLAFDKILISLLEKEGIVINTPTAIDIQRILANTSIKDQTFGKLKYKIAPILCRNKEDQVKIYQIFDDLDYNFPLEITLPEVDNFSTTLQSEGVVVKKINYKLLLILISIALIGFLSWYFFKTLDKEEKLILEGDDSGIVYKPIEFKAFLQDSTKTKNYTVDWNIDSIVVKNKWEFEQVFKIAKSYKVRAFLRNKENKIVDTVEKYVEVLCEETPTVTILNSQTNQPNKELYIPVIYNASKDSAKYSYRWFVDHKLTSKAKNLIIAERKFNVYREIQVIINSNGAHCKTDTIFSRLHELPSIRSQIVADGLPLKLSKSINWGVLSLIILLLFIIPFLFSILLFYFLRKKKPVIPPKIETEYGMEEPYSIEFSEQDFLINDENGINSLADKLRKRQLSEILKLNIRKTIKSSLTSIGLPQFVFTQLSKPTEYVILFDKERNNSHLIRLFGYLIKKLQSEQVNLTFYEYYQEPLFLSNQKLNLIRIPIEKVATFHPEAILIIIGDSKNFVYPIKKVLKDWVITKFRTWETKILLTPFAINDWDIKERLISESGFLVIPTDMNAQNNLDKVIFKQIDRQKDLQIPSSYPTRFLNLQTIEGLKNYLDNENLKTWLFSLAIYPLTDWNLTIAIGHALEEKLKSEGQLYDLVNYSNLLKLSRISWMHDSSWSESLRVEMLQQLSNEDEVLARETLLKQLNIFKEKLSDNSLIKREFDVHHDLNSFMVDVYRKDPNALKKEQIVEDMLNKFHVDEASEIYLNKGINTLLKNPKNENESLKIRDYLEASNEFEKLKRKNHNFKSFIASTAALLLLMILSYNLLCKFNLLELKKTAISTITFKMKGIVNNTGNSYKGIIVIDSIQKEFTVKKDTSFVVKVPVSDTTSFGKYQLEYFGDSNSNFSNLDSFRLNKNSYTLSLENTPQIPVTIFYQNNNQRYAESLESYFPGAFDIQKKQTNVLVKDYFIYYFNRKFESYANSCASIINKNLNKNIRASLIDTTGVIDSTNAAIPRVLLGIIIPKYDVNTWIPATLPSSLTEIWQGKVNDLKVMINLSKKVLYYSTKGKDTYGTYSIYKVFQKGGKFKVILSSNKGYKLFFFNNITATSFDISICFKYFKTDAELFSIVDSECNPYVNMTPSQQYSRDPNLTYLPVNTSNYNWNSLFRTRKFSSNSNINIEYTNNTLLPPINLSNLKKSSLNINQMIKSATVLSNPFERNFIRATMSIDQSPAQSPASNTSTVHTKKKVLWVDYISEKNNSIVNKFKNENINQTNVYVSL